MNRFQGPWNRSHKPGKVYSSIYLNPFWVFALCPAAEAHGAICAMQPSSSNQALPIQLAHLGADVESDGESLSIHSVLVSDGGVLNLFMP